MVDTVGINETTDWNLLKTILRASYSTFFKMSSARAETWNNKQTTEHERKINTLTWLRGSIYTALSIFQKKQKISSRVLMQISQRNNRTIESNKKEYDVRSLHKRSRFPASRICFHRKRFKEYRLSDP